jgi:hypothetical protein
MKKSVLKAAAIAAVSIFSASGAFAQTATQTIGLNAFVNALCTINGTANGALGETGTVATSGTGAIAQTLSLTSGGSYALACSTPNTITITSANDGIRATTPGAGVNNINYTATVGVGGASPILTQALTTTGSGTQKQVVSAASPAAVASGTMTITIATQAAVGLSPGGYADTLTVLLTPQ